LKGNGQVIELSIQILAEVIIANVCDQSDYAMGNGAQEWGGRMWLEYGHS